MNSPFETKLLRADQEEEISSFFDSLEIRLQICFKDQTALDLFLLAVVEAINNALEHGHGHEPDKTVRVVTGVGPSLALVQVVDEGPGFSPVFRELKEIKGARGRGLGIIKQNSDLMLFNRKGNQILIAAGGAMDNKSDMDKGTGIVELKDAVVFITGLKARPGQGLHQELHEYLGRFSRSGPRTLCIDLREVRLFSSREWGLIFAEAEEEDVREIVLFNAGQAVMTAARQMGVGTRGAPFDKISLFPGLEEVIARLEKTISDDDADQEA